MVAITRAREGHWDQAALAASIMLACGGAGVGASRWVRLHAHAVGSFRAIARSESQRALDVARGLGRRRSPHLRPRRRKSPDDHRDRMVRRHATNLVHRAAPRTPRRRLLGAAISRSSRSSASQCWHGRCACDADCANTANLASRLLRCQDRSAAHSLGSIHIDHPLPAGQQVALELECINRTTRGAWHNLTTWDRTLWRSDQTSMSDSAGSIPIAFMIAPDCRPTDDSNPNSRIVWRLGARAGAYRAEFEVPVFLMR